MPRLLKAIDDLHTASARFLFSGWRAEWEAPTDRDHRAILNALKAGQTELAASILARHVHMDAVRFADDLAHAGGILTKEIAPIAAPVPYEYFTRHRPFIRDAGQSVVVMVAPYSIDHFAALVAQKKGECCSAPTR